LLDNIETNLLPGIEDIESTIFSGTAAGKAGEMESATSNGRKAGYMNGAGSKASSPLTQDVVLDNRNGMTSRQLETPKIINMMKP